MAGGEVVYEVNLQVDAAIADDFTAWLQAHVREMLALPGFLEALEYRVQEPAPAAELVGFCVHYRLRDAAALEHYLAEHAPRMRAEGMARFGERMRAQRRVLSSLV